MTGWIISTMPGEIVGLALRATKWRLSSKRQTSSIVGSSVPQNSQSSGWGMSGRLVVARGAPPPVVVVVVGRDGAVRGLGIGGGTNSGSGSDGGGGGGATCASAGPASIEMAAAALMSWRGDMI